LTLAPLDLTMNDTTNRDNHVTDGVEDRNDRARFHRTHFRIDLARCGYPTIGQ